MFEPSSRYAPIPEGRTTEASGREVVYKLRRFLPAPEALRLLVEVTVAQGDRLDLIAGRTLGDPEQSWRICDASNAMHPAELTEEPGRVLRVPVPEALA
ncbi:MAG: hypothetical protein EYC70_09045 [Planctomycetota bacterium]|nr:MAG: hypothetical protein EYC70_09045 [Planctomycetota bacterium]